jgi:peptidoglycan hydrolase-like protein with peptidoglycan-binding domain
MSDRARKLEAWVLHACQEHDECVQLTMRMLRDAETHPTLRRAHADEPDAYVLLFQALLHTVGHAVELDGLMGEQTEAATKEFQAEHFHTADGEIDEAEVDGVVGDNSWKEIARLQGTENAMRLETVLLAADERIAERATRQLVVTRILAGRAPEPPREPSGGELRLPAPLPTVLRIPTPTVWLPPRPWPPPRPWVYPVPLFRPSPYL